MSLTEQPRTCPSCAAANRPTRELCARCGAGLDDGVVPPHAERGEAPDPPVDDAAPVAPHRWLLPLIGAFVLVAVVVLGLTLAGLGPLASGPDIPNATFDADGYGTEPDDLLLSDVATRTSAPDADAAAIADGDPTTAWRSAGTATAEGVVLDTIDLVLEDPAWIERLELRNGDHRDREAYDSTAPLREVRLSFDGGVAIMVDLLDIGTRAQAVELPDPVLTSVVRIDVLRAVPGRSSDQLAVSDIRLVGWTAVGDDAELAGERARVRPATQPAHDGRRSP